MNRDDFLHADGGVIVFGASDNPTLPIWLLNAGGLQCSFTYWYICRLKFALMSLI